MNALSSLVLSPVVLFLLGQTPSPAATPAPAAAPAAGAPVATPPAVESFHGHGVFYPDAVTDCPQLGIGTRGPHACLRIGLDDEHSAADLDRANHKIVFRNDGTYKSETIVGDVILPGWSESAKAGRTPVEVHVVVRKKGSSFSTKVYSHVVTHEKPTKVEIENLQVVLSDGKTETVVLTDEKAQKAVIDPGLAAKTAGFLTEITDNLEKASPKEGEPKPTGDITISIGLGPAAKKVMRVQLFRTGADSELRLTALSGLVPKYVIQRDLFLYGIEDAAAVADIKKRGLKSGETLVMSVHDGKGTVTFGKLVSDLPDAANSMRDFLETAFVGMVLAHQAHLDAPH